MFTLSFIEEEIIALVEKSDDGKIGCVAKKIPAGLIFKEGKFHGTKDIVLLLGSSENKADVLVALEKTILCTKECVMSNIHELEEFIINATHEEIKVERFLELTEGKKEKLRCGCRGYVCVIGDERRLEIYELT